MDIMSPIGIFRTFKNVKELRWFLLSNIVRIQGIGPTFAEKLVAAGIKTTEKLLVAVSSKKGRTQIAEEIGIKENLILEWVTLRTFS